MRINDYLISTDDLDRHTLLSSWTWLTGDKWIVAITKAGDALLTDDNGHIYFLP